MSVVTDIEKLAFNLPVADRAKLAERLWKSIPEEYIDDQEFQEAIRRDREMTEDPSKVLTHEEFFRFFKERRK